jgi:hypothetical protein
MISRNWLNFISRVDRGGKIAQTRNPRICAPKLREDADGN